MFRENKKHFQGDIFGFEIQLPKSKLKKLYKSKEYYFYKLIFIRINEKDFSVLYSDKKSRPNAPINVLISSLILLQRNNWTYEELFNHIDFDLLTRIALGLFDLSEAPFSETTIFNFQDRLIDYYIKTGVNLLERVFDRLTSEQLKALKIKTNIQRSDSFLVASNIREYSRVQLLIEVLIRFYRILKEEEKQEFKERFSSYIKKTSGQYIYSLKRSEIPKELEKLGQLYHQLYESFSDIYGDTEIFKILERVYVEHFTLVNEKIEVKSSDELHSSILQSPDDIDATYRKKGNQENHGRVVNVTETANPENQINLINDVCEYPNNTDDSEILNDRIDVIKEKTPDLDEFHTDGGYGSESNDKKMAEYKINHIQSAVKGRKNAVNIKIEKLSDNNYEVSCEFQKVESELARKRYKAVFSGKQCKECPMSELCPIKHLRRKRLDRDILDRVYYFSESDYLSNKRHRAIEKIPIDRRKIRPNVEATVCEFRRVLNHKGKLKVRGAFKTATYAFNMAISINFGRIYRYLSKNLRKDAFIFCLILFVLRKLMEFCPKFPINERISDYYKNSYVLTRNHQLILSLI